ncbi:MAG TPA: peptidylprolyl isomerase [Mycobacteriales bacterium]|nr:peptidylprolyl isomerase [Mycobacteriales bacterium]
MSDAARVTDTVGVVDGVGTVAGREVPGELLDTRLAELRAGPMADRLPPEHSLEGRRLRRWVAQLVLTEELIRTEARRLGVGNPEPDVEPRTDPGATDRPPPGFAGPVPRYGHRTEPVPWSAGSLASAVLAALPLARALYRRVTDHIQPGEDRARDYYRRNPELWEHPERRTLLHVHSTEPSDPARLWVDGTWWTCTRDELPEPLAKLAFSAAPKAIVGPVNTPFGWQVCLIGRITPAHALNFDTVRDEILARLTRSARDRYFERWVERRRSALVTTAVGCEHPGDPRHSDYAHHH